MHQPTAYIYIAAGLTVVPANRQRKSPVNGEGMNSSWKNLTIELAAERWNNLTAVQDAIALIAGKISGNVEIIDFDHGGIKFSPWSQIIPESLLNKLVIERSPSGGVHVGYRCDKIEGNIKLAWPEKPTDTKEWKAYIETRGEGGLCLISPSPGYRLVKNDWNLIPTITPDERDTLISAARSLTEHFPQPKAPKPRPIQSTTPPHSHGNDERPGDRYNGDANADTVVSLLISAGWTDLGGGFVARPGKDTGGVSGSVAENGAFYCFTTSNSDFEGGESYSPYGVYAIVTHHGDFGAAGRELAAKYGLTRQRHEPKEIEWKSDALDLFKEKAAEEEPAAGPTMPCFALPAESLDRLPKYVRHFATYLAATTCGVIDARHVMLAIAGYAALLGKRVKFQNWGVDYYCNLATAILSKSGTAKSNLKYLVGEVLRQHSVEISDLTTATAEGIIGQYSVTVSSSAADKAAKRQEAKDETAKQPGVTIMTDELLALTGSMLREQEQAKYARLLCKLLDNDTISTLTKKDGLAIWHDQCVNVIGLSQVDSFEGALRTPAFVEAGLSGRIIPVDDKMAKWSMTLAAGNVHSDMEEINKTDRFNMHFGSGDCLGTSIAKIEEIAKSQIPLMLDDWQQLRSKILVFGAKISSVLAVLDYVEKHPANDNPFHDVPTAIDASPWATVGMALVHSCHASNLYYVGIVGEQHDKIRKLIELKGQLTKRDLCKYTGWQSYEVDTLLRDLIDSGDVRKVVTSRTVKFESRK
ncbi:MAG TPA: bifunctional DNA primase/polymerase [Tepidisphaeraceae bacterium]|jgi:hypothetical protein|nr:bifunctional DNA primase/polymerase [Tepidisphaeraceae bacterium]